MISFWDPQASFWKSMLPLLGILREALRRVPKGVDRGPRHAWDSKKDMVGAPGYGCLGIPKRD